MRLSVIVPVLNEAATLEQILDRLIASPVVDEIVIVDDGSRDRTFEIARRYEEESRARIGQAPEGYPASGVEASSVARRTPPSVIALKHEWNKGKGRAIRTGLERVTGDVVTIQDGDLEYDPMDFVPMMREMEKGARVVYGSRILGQNRFSYRRFYWGGRMLSLASNLLYGLSITDEPTCYKMAQTDLLRRMDFQCERFEFCPEMTAKAARLGAAIVEIPISYAPRGIAEGKKIRWWDGVEALWTLLRYRFWRPAMRK